ncbi:unnamed protein product, partial [Mesorhabditis belari]|uniref:Fibronectin type-III domain-containing protein n=1 Tax=Mesorhabditis belari TaxID=2138241 RepID=A0AAF3FRS6_9BILA
MPPLDSEKFLYFTLFLIQIQIPSIHAGTSLRAKCALECYDRCMQTGTAIPMQCNCPVQHSFRTCTSVNNRLLNADVPTLIPTAVVDYLDAHTIKINLEQVEGAFVYVFEFATVGSGEPEDWMFAVASPSPSVKFTVGDPCRDYQFRVIVLMRSTNPADPFVLLRPRVIPRRLPPFAIDPNMITVDEPTPSVAMETLKILVKWTVPPGFDDSDIYGYESPAVYPIQCKTPEDELPIPRIEILPGGGQLVVMLPASILEARCRLWVEVRMLPRCARLQPFLIQKSLELDCEKSPNIEVCKRDAQPVCTSVIDVWGSDGKATIMWAPPDQRSPLYYHVRYGPAQMQGIPPVVSWQIVQKRDVKVQGGVKSFTLDLSEDTDYGVQVCAIYSSHRQRAKLGVVPVTPFICSSCSNTPMHSMGRCGECTKIEISNITVGNPKIDDSTTTTTSTMKSALNKVLEIKKINSMQKSKSQTVLRMEADLIVHEKNKKVEDIRKVENDLPKKNSVAKNMGTHVAEVKNVNVEQSIEKGGLLANSDIGEGLNWGWEAIQKLESHSADRESAKTHLKLKKPIPSITHAIFTHEIRRLKNDPLNMVIKKVQTTEEAPSTSTLSSTTTSNTITTTISPSTVPPTSLELKVGGVRTLASPDERLFPLPGFAFADSPLAKRFDNPLNVRKSVGPCLPRANINATWDPETQTVQVKSREIRTQLARIDDKDGLFIEFGPVQATITQLTPNHTLERWTFVNVKGTRQKMVVPIQKILESQIFALEPFVFQVNQSIKETSGKYGLKICPYKTREIQNPYTHNWNLKQQQENNGNVQDSQVSPLFFQSNPLLNGEIYRSPESYWNVVFTIGKIALLIVLVLIMSILVYLNCTKLKILYDRKRTHYFRPFYVDPVHVTTVTRTYGVEPLHDTTSISNPAMTPSRSFSTQPSGAQLYAKRRHIQI